MKTFTVLTVSKRTGWEGIAMDCMAKQTVQAKEWVVVREYQTEYMPISFLSNAYRPKGMKTIISPVKAPEQIRASNLNASLNEGLRAIKTDYVIFYQDFIELPEDCFEKLLDLADEKTLVTTCTPNYDGSNDSRYLGTDQPRKCRPAEWEANVAIAPMKVIKELGGFDEDYDNGWSWDNVNVAERAAMLGCKFIIDESNRPKLLPHEQTSKLAMELNAERHNKTMQDIREGRRPLKLPYV